MSNCAAGIVPLWQPAQYFSTNGRTFCANWWSSAALAATAGALAKASKRGNAQGFITTLPIISPHETPAATPPL
jgi:hypothetical protein